MLCPGFNVSAVQGEGDGAVHRLRVAAFRKRKQEVHDFPYLSQFCDPFTKLVRIGVVTFDGGVTGIFW